jgi:indolepyruvate ferredoxin oxidoreductase alpha subunit
MENMSIESIVIGLQDGGVKSVYNFPGFHSHEIAEGLGMRQISLNERAAYAEGYGASLAGSRTVVAFKNVGLNVASDAFLHSIIGGVNAGLVVVVTDDILVVGSQESQDSRHYFDFYGGFWYEPESPQDAYNFACEAFALSEQLDVPIVIRLTGSFFANTSAYTRGHLRKDSSRAYIKRPEKHIVHPYYFKRQEINLNKKRRQIEAYVEKLNDVPVNTSRGLIVFGSANTTNREDDILRVKTLPLPQSQILTFIKAHDGVEIVEDGDEYVHKKIAALLGGALLTSAVQSERGVVSKFVKWNRDEIIFNEINAVLRSKPVTGDITQFTVETTNTIDVALSLGVAVSTAIGIADVKGEAYAIVGDTSFLHEGIGVIDEAVTRNLNVGVIIIDNGVSWCTGGQIPAGSLDTIMGLTNSQTIDCTGSFDITTLKDALCRLESTEGVRILRIHVSAGNLVRRS